MSHQFKNGLPCCCVYSVLEGTADTDNPITADGTVTYTFDTVSLNKDTSPGCSNHTHLISTRQTNEQRNVELPVIVFVEAGMLDGTSGDLVTCTIEIKADGNTLVTQEGITLYDWNSNVANHNAIYGDRWGIDAANEAFTSRPLGQYYAFEITYAGELTDVTVEVTYSGIESQTTTTTQVAPQEGICALPYTITADKTVKVTFPYQYAPNFEDYSGQFRLVLDLTGDTGTTLNHSVFGGSQSTEGDVTLTGAWQDIEGSYHTPAYELECVVPAGSLIFNDAYVEVSDTKNRAIAGDAWIEAPCIPIHFIDYEVSNTTGAGSITHPCNSSGTDVDSKTITLSSVGGGCQCYAGAEVDLAWDEIGEIWAGTLSGQNNCSDIDIEYWYECGEGISYQAYLRWTFDNECQDEAVHTDRITRVAVKAACCDDEYYRMTGRQCNTYPPSNLSVTIENVIGMPADNQAPTFIGDLDALDTCVDDLEDTAAGTMAWDNATKSYVGTLTVGNVTGEANLLTRATPCYSGQTPGAWYLIWRDHVWELKQAVGQSCGGDTLSLTYQITAPVTSCQTPLCDGDARGTDLDINTGSSPYGLLRFDLVFEAAAPLLAQSLTEPARAAPLARKVKTVKAHPRSVRRGYRRARGCGCSGSR